MDDLQKRGVFYCEMPNFEAPLTDGLMKCERRCGTVGMLLGFGYCKSNEVLEMGRG